MNRWPAVTGKQHVAARKACLGVLEGLKEARDARRAFVEAAKEADILVSGIRSVERRSAFHRGLDCLTVNRSPRSGASHVQRLRTACPLG
ncbi:DUF982 domain-containing protein [Mesorhizobium onobrychidis]|uniref:DUF982 domain-containing protein n=1 Tax=Mesorhizobium onobrychidis TaxID=2775404 RepID=UPI0021586538|nr:DUF982 domain-containing protein [Mesorhizobium onobrychidis]